MTAEIVVMNREGAAIAADSAVTLGDSKVYNSANKLFMLRPDIPIGILIYSTATFMALPWEIIIKLYKDYLINEDIAFLSLEECGDEFINFLKKNNQRIADIDQQKIIITNLSQSIFREIKSKILSGFGDILYNTSSMIPESEIINVIKTTIDLFYKQFAREKYIFTRSECNSLAIKFFESFHELIVNIINQVFEQSPLDEDDKEKLYKICYYLVCKDIDTPINSGIVFIGYGKNDLLPVCSSFTIEFCISGLLKYKKDEKHNNRIGFNSTSAVVIPFAQGDMVQNFLLGAHPEMFNTLERVMKRNKVTQKKTKKILMETNKEMRSNYTDSILNAIVSLPKEDLALVAETLINLTSFKKKVSMVTETVGGPIDVAVISKKDGFIWIKRKHYFEYDENIHVKDIMC